MNRKLISIAIATALGTATLNAEATLVNGSALNFAASAGGTVMPTIGSGSWFSLLISSTTTLYTGISSHNGLMLGTTQLASGSHIGAPGCTPGASCNNAGENPNIDNPWQFSGSTGMHQTTSNSNVLSAAGNAATVDMSGWSFDWNSISDIPLSGGGIWGDPGIYSEGIGRVVCGVDCGVNDTYTLDYHGIIPAGDPSSLGGVSYGLHLEGAISAVPVPAAVWLFGSGLTGLLGIAKRKQKTIGIT